jgi:3-phenylpropionate/trans-cinnamate dioxygenase ferredoxin reductase subunit
MAGVMAPPPLEAPWFWSDQYDVKLQMVGLSQAHDSLVVRGAPESAAFSVFYFKAGELLGVDSINRPAEHMLARKLMSLGISPSPDAVADTGFDLKTLLPAP